MTDTVPLVLVGNSLAVMVAATRLADEGAEVTLINSSANWGGHFTTITSDGVRFDPGMVLHEFTSFSPQCSAAELQTYDPAIRNDVGRFCNVVKDYISRYQDSKPIHTPSMYVGGEFLDDLLIANSLNTLKALPFTSAVASELSSLGTPSDLHASRKHKNRDFAAFDFEAVSLANHGTTLHRQMIEPFCRKLLGVSTRNIQALYHRVAWLPLYYPETLLSYIADSPQELASTIFSYPAGGCVGDLAGGMKNAILSNQRITVITDRPVRLTEDNNECFDIAFENRGSIRAQRLAWGNPLSELVRALDLEPAGGYEKCSIALTFIRVPILKLRRSFTVLSVVDPDYAIYRVTNQSQCAGESQDYVRLVVECNPDYASSIVGNNSDMNGHLLMELVRLGIIADASDIKNIETKSMKNALLLPTKANYSANDNESKLALLAAPGIARIGPSSGYFSTSFNDQIVQGLKLASAWKV